MKACFVGTFFIGFVIATGFGIIFFIDHVLPALMSTFGGGFLAGVFLLALALLPSKAIGEAVMLELKRRRS